MLKAKITKVKTIIRKNIIKIKKPYCKKDVNMNIRERVKKPPLSRFG